MAEKKFQDLDLNNAFLFSAALEDAETCRMILEIILGQPVPKVCVHTEHSLLLNSDYRSARLNIYASDEFHVEYNLEMQNENTGSLPQRSRFYQAVMDASALQPGDDYSELPPVYTVFICTFDPFNLNCYRYTFENICVEKDFPLKDGTKKIFLNTRGKNPQEVPEELVNFLHYVENSTDEYVRETDDTAIVRLHSRVSALKKNREWEHRYMQVEELIRRAELKAEKKGHRDGQEQMLKLVRHMIADGSQDQLVRLESDESFYQEMLKKYQI